jgi:hypothetical protein
LAHSCQNAIHVLEIDGVPLVAHDDKVTALTAYYSNILGAQGGHILGTTSTTSRIATIERSRARC